MTLFNRGLTAVFDVLFYPLRWLPPVAGLAAVALVSAIVALLVVKRTSNQGRLRDAKNGMYAALLEMRLFNDDLGAILRATVDVLASNARYLRASFVPVLWLIVPFGLLVTHLDAFYAYRGLAVAEPALVTATLAADGRTTDAALTLDAPAGLHVDTPAVSFPATHEVMWRLLPSAPGEFSVRVHAGAVAIDKRVGVGDAIVRRSALRPAATWIDEISAPSEPPIDAGGPVRSLSVSYPARDLTVLGYRMPWLLVYFGLTIVFGLALGRLLRVEI